MITAQTPAAQTPAAPAADDAPSPPVRAALAGAIDVQAHRMDQLSAAIVHATAQVTWSGRAAERFRARAAERSRECLQLAVALRASAERVQVAAMGPTVHAGPGPDRAGGSRVGGGGSFEAAPANVGSQAAAEPATMASDPAGSGYAR